jgi:hypothetical protein
MKQFSTINNQSGCDYIDTESSVQPGEEVVVNGAIYTVTLKENSKDDIILRYDRPVLKYDFGEKIIYNGFLGVFLCYTNHKQNCFIILKGYSESKVVNLSLIKPASRS